MPSEMMEIRRSYVNALHDLQQRDAERFEAK